MRVAIMQPYVFPYLGYYQLLHAADVFVCFDDVNFIKKGWINRNRILLNGAPFTFTIPIQGMSQNITIRDSHIAPDPAWQTKLLGNLKQGYGHTPFYNAIFPLIKPMIQRASGSIADLAEATVRLVVDYLALPVRITRSSALGIAEDIKGQERIIQVAKAHGAAHYINPANGAHLYNEERFALEGMTLRFLRMDPDLRDPQQGKTDFVPGLSMLDILMNVPPEGIRALLARYTLHTEAELALLTPRPEDPAQSE